MQTQATPSTAGLVELARRYWGISMVRGVIAIIFGLLAIFWPSLTFNLFMYIFGVFALIQGIDLLANAYTQYHVPGQEQDQAFTRTYTPVNQAGETTSETFTRGESSARVYETTSTGYAGTGARAQATPLPPRTVKSWTVLTVEGALSILCGLLAMFLPGVIGSLALYALAAWILFTAVSAFSQTQQRGLIQFVIGVLAVILFVAVFLNPLQIIHSLLWLIGLFSLVMGVLLVARGLTYNATTAQERDYEARHFGPRRYEPRYEG